MPNCLYLPAWLWKKTETCTKCHELGFVWKLKSSGPCPRGAPAGISSCLLRFPRVLLTLGPACQTHFASCLLLLHPWLRKFALITGSVCPLFSDKPIRSQAEAPAALEPSWCQHCHHVATGAQCTGRRLECRPVGMKLGSPEVLPPNLGLFVQMSLTAVLATSQ